MNRFSLSLMVTVAWCCGWLSTDCYAVELFVNPDCPSPTNSVSILAYQQNPPPAFLPGNSVERNGNAFTIKVRATNSVIGEAPPSSALVTLGPLAVGSYHIDLVGQFSSGGGVTSEVTLASKDFVVQTDPPACTPATVVPSSGAFQATQVNSAYPAPLQVLVSDAEQRPVNGVTVNFMRLNRPEDVDDPNAPRPDVTLSSVTATTNSAGLAEVTAVANNIVGTAQYLAYIVRAGVTLKTYFILANRTDSHAQSLEPVVEFYNSSLDHYFMTANPTEMTILDSGGHVGWSRTGAVFLAFSTDAGPTGLGPLRPVCRFYGRPEAGLDSHFFTASADECAQVIARFSSSWLLETANAFEILLPDFITGACPSGTEQVFRAYNNRADANHRYSTSKAVIKDMIDSGWIAEGYGPDAAVMCAPL